MRSTSCTISTIAVLTGAGTPAVRAASTTAPFRKSISVSCPRRMLCRVDPGFGTEPIRRANSRGNAAPTQSGSTPISSRTRPGTPCIDPNRTPVARATRTDSRMLAVITSRSPSWATASCTLSPVMAGSAFTWLMSSFVHCAPRMSWVTSTGSAPPSTPATRSRTSRGVESGAPITRGFLPVTNTCPGLT